MEQLIAEHTSSSTMSFLELITRYVVNIPVIQRDYAQGRNSDEVKGIREQFVKDLLYFISDNGQSHNIDYVYGTVEHSPIDNEEIFIPIDGQQRITTLFLLHLYIAGMSDNFDEFYKIIKGHFKYSTRKSSTDFCREIIESGSIWRDFISLKGNKPETKLSGVIKNQGWFFETWENDPTVAGMLVMLDEIDSQISGKNVNSLYDNLFEPAVPPVVFQWQPLNGYTRTDDLYIKMNARGLKLTSFEIFKALYEKSLDHCPEYKKEFEEKIDGEWCDFLWEQEQSNTDKVFERVIRLMIGCGYIESVHIASQDILDKIFCFNGKDINFSYSKFSEYHILHDIKVLELSEDYRKREVAIVKNIIETLDVLCDENSPIVNESICLPWYDENAQIKVLLHDNLKKINYEQLVYFYAYVKFLTGYPGCKIVELPQWMRLIYNLLNATNINKSTDMAEVFVSINNMIADMKGNSVVEWLCTKPSIRKFSQNQVFEEFAKASLIKWGAKNDEPNWRKLIDKNEADEYLRGQIGHLLVISKVYLDDYSSFSKNESDDALKIFEKVSRRARLVFSHFKRSSSDGFSESHILEQAMLTCGFYLRKNSSSRYNFCNQPFDRDNSWRRLFEVPEKEKTNDGINAFGKLLMAQWEDEADAKTSLEKIYQEYLNNPICDTVWYSPFLGKYGKSLIGICAQGFIHNNNGYITLMHQSQMNHYHSELLSREFYLDLKQDFSFVHYESVRSGEQNPGFYFEISISGIPITLFIYQCNGWWMEIYDKSMFNRLYDTPNWNICIDLLCELTGKKEEEIKDCCKVEKSYIIKLLGQIKNSQLQGNEWSE